jgi:ectoine hydroxylase-related dioxygenase (phytanoyl-CoA dioxygenase family)
LMARSPKCRELALDPKINALAEKFLEPHSDGYQLHFTSAISIGPNETAQILHRDRGVWGGYVPRKIETQFSTVWAITDFTKENGATQIVPGSHKWDKTRAPMAEEIENAEMSAGSVFIYTGSVMHGGGENKTSENRLGVFLHYAPNWLRQEENQYLSCPPSIAKDLKPELRDLMGYSQGGYVLGFFTDPTDTEGKFESVSPKKLFGEDTDRFKIDSSQELVSSSTKKN